MKKTVIAATIALLLAGCASAPAQNMAVASSSGCGAPARGPSAFGEADALARRATSLSCGGGGSAYRQARDREIANRSNTPAEQAIMDERLALFGQGRR